jgi:hypothetical protein
VGDIPLYVAWLVTEGNGYQPAVTLHAGVTLPSGNGENVNGLDKPLFGVGMQASKRLGTSDNLLYLGLGLTHTEQDEMAKIDLEQQELTAMLGWEHEWSRRTSFLAQYLMSSPAAVDYYQFSEPAHELNVGIKHLLNDKTLLEWSFTENLFNFDNSTDVGMHLGLMRIF